MEICTRVCIYGFVAEWAGKWLCGYDLQVSQLVATVYEDERRVAKLPKGSL